MRLIKPVFIQFLKFGIVGVFNTLISYLCYVGLVYIGIAYLVANLISFIVSVFNSFYWNNKYVFKKQHGEDRKFWIVLIKTYIAYGIVLIISSFLLVLLVEKFNISEYLAPIIVLTITVPLNFIINKVWTFKKMNKEGFL